MLYPLIRDYSTGERIGEKIIWEFSHPYLVSIHNFLDKTHQLAN